MDSDIKMEYAKSKARVARWEEEILLIAEEMRRTVEFLRWKAKDWIEHRGRREVEPDIQRGLEAYALRQAYQFKAIATKFSSAWHDILSLNNLPMA